MTPPAERLAESTEQITRAITALDDAAVGLLIAAPNTSTAYQEAVRAVLTLSLQAEQALVVLEGKA